MNDLPQNVGQLLCIGFEGRECGPELRKLLRQVRPGGVIFFQRNIAAEEQFRALVAGIRAELKDFPPFLAIDQEGGQVDRFRELLGPLPSAREAAQVGMAFELGEMAGRELAVFGLNVDFAPVLDLGVPESAAVLGTRTAGGTPEQVIAFAERFLAGLNQWGVAGCGKHFPGLGGGRKDSHLVMPVIEKAADTLWSDDMAPFRRLAGLLPMVMVAHCRYPALAANSGSTPVPASLSPRIVSGLLRERIGYQGLIVCDDLEMGGALEGRGMGEAAIETVRAGCDVLLVCRHAEHVMDVHSALVKAGERDAAFRDLVMRATSRIERAARLFSPAKQFAGDVNVLREVLDALRGALAARTAGQSARST